MSCARPEPFAMAKKLRDGTCSASAPSLLHTASTIAPTNKHTIAPTNKHTIAPTYSKHHRSYKQTHHRSYKQTHHRSYKKTNAPVNTPSLLQTSAPSLLHWSNFQRENYSANAASKAILCSEPAVVSRTFRSPSVDLLSETK
jgi:hypothetical protein